jgi:hypothetical protein
MILIAPAMACSNEKARHTVAVKQTSDLVVTYDQLTDYCLNHWGLSKNPYPAYSPTDKTAYRIFTITIGHDKYQGVSCNTYTYVYNPTTKTLTLTYNAVWYLGDFGKENARMNQGFAGTVIVQNYQYGYPTSYYSAQFNLQGFHQFNHQSLMLTIDDSRISALATGICQTLGNRDECRR